MKAASLFIRMTVCRGSAAGVADLKRACSTRTEHPPAHARGQMVCSKTSEVRYDTSRRRSRSTSLYCPFDMPVKDIRHLPRLAEKVSQVRLPALD
jgi:hypothetical protein